jgi:hypothetical protein
LLDILTIETWKKTYTFNFPLVDITDLQKFPLSEYNHPLTRVPRGRPKSDSGRAKREGNGGMRWYKL